MIRALRIFAMAWFTLALVVILAGYASILYFQGLGELLAVMSPFNFWNFLAIVAILLPGLGANRLAERLEARRRSATAIVVDRQAV